MTISTRRTLISALAGIALLGASWAWAEGDAPPTEPAPAKHDPNVKPHADQGAPDKDAAVKPASPHQVSGSGSVVAYNYTGHGAIESLMIRTEAGVVQVNIPPESADVLKNFPLNENVKFEARPEGKPRGDHAVYKLLSVTNSSGAVLRDNKEDGDKKVAHVEGTVQALNYSRSGEVNGVILDTGDFIHLTPEGAQQINPKVGDKFAADGKTTPSVTGHQAIEAQTVNGQAVQHKPKPEGKQPPKPHGDANKPPKESGKTPHPEANP